MPDVRGSKRPMLVELVDPTEAAVMRRLDTTTVGVTGDALDTVGQSRLRRAFRNFD